MQKNLSEIAQEFVDLQYELNGANTNLSRLEGGKTLLSERDSYNLKEVEQVQISKIEIEAAKITVSELQQNVLNCIKNLIDTLESLGVKPGKEIFYNFKDGNSLKKLKFHFDDQGGFHHQIVYQ